MPHTPSALKRCALALLLALCALQPVCAAPAPDKNRHRIDSIRRVLPNLRGDEKADALGELFRSYYAGMQVDSALNTLDQLIEYQHSRGKTEREAAARWNRIATLNNATRYDSLLVEADKQMTWFEENGIWDRFYQTWQRKCSANHDLGRMQSALREAQAMGNDAKKRNNNVGRAMAYKQMGVVYFDIRQLDQAAKAFLQSIRLLKEDGDDTGILSGVYDGYCQTLDRQKKYPQELAAANEWQSHLNVLLTKRGIEVVSPVFVSCHLAQAAAHIGLKQFEEAKMSLKEANRYQEMSSSTLGKYYLYEMHARLELAQGNVAKAIAYTDSTLRLGVTVDEKIEELRADALLQYGSGSEAAHIYKNLYDRKDSLFTRDMRTQLDELNTLFRVDEIQKEQQRVRLLFIAAITTLIIAALIIFLILRSRAAKRLAQKNKELAQKNKELQLANAQVQESANMKSEFIKSISHEIRTPLNILSGYTQVMASEDIELDQQRMSEMKKHIEQNTNRITQLVNKIIELSEINTKATITREDTVKAVTIAERAASDERMTALKDVAFAIHADEQMQKEVLLTNANSATRALALLLDNAKKFTRQGSITIDIKKNAGQGMIDFAVTDTGVGVSPYEAERIFNEFVQLDKFSEGTGIGLTVARSIARRLEGDIRLDTSYSKGARFILSLPAKD